MDMCHMAKACVRYGKWRQNHFRLGEVGALQERTSEPRSATTTMKPPIVKKAPALLEHSEEDDHPHPAEESFFW